MYYLKTGGFCGETLHETYSPRGGVELENHSAKCTLPSPPSLSSLIFQPTFNLTELSAFFEANNFASSQKASEQKIIRRSSPPNFPFQNYQTMYINTYQFKCLKLCHLYYDIIFYKLSISSEWNCPGPLLT